MLIFLRRAAVFIFDFIMYLATAVSTWDNHTTTTEDGGEKQEVA